VRQATSRYVDEFLNKLAPLTKRAEIILQTKYLYCKKSPLDDRLVTNY